MFTLRPYQEKAVKTSIKFLTSKKKKGKGLLILPTGAGKSIIIAKICQELNEKVLIFQPSKELLIQNVNKFRQIGGECSIYSASASEKILSNVTFATIGSVYNLGKELKSHGVKYVLIDEAHLVSNKKKGESASMYQKLFNDLGIVKTIGLTATPFRNYVTGDRWDSFTCAKFLTRTSPKFFTEVIHVTQISEMVENHWWKKLDYRYYPFDSSKLILNSTGGDYKEESLRDWFYSTNLLDLVSECVDICIQKKHKKSILIFVPSVEIATLLSQRIPNSTFVHGGLNKKDREERLKDFNEGKYTTMINCEILTTGYDNPDIDCILLCRPTQSLALYMQMVGRLVRIPTRPMKGLVVDFTDCVDKFGIVEDLTIENIKDWGWGVFSKFIDKDGNKHKKLLTGVNLNNPSPVTIKDIQRQIINKNNLKNQDCQDFVLSFGKYNGCKLLDVPFSYLTWYISSTTKNGLTEKKIQEYLDLCNQDVKFVEK